MIYLASPYSSPVPAIELQRYVAARDFTAEAMLRGHILFSPIVYCFQFQQHYDLPGDAMFWKDLNRAMLLRCSEVWVLQLDGWQSSVGVRLEIDWANNLEKPVKMVEPYE